MPSVISSTVPQPKESKKPRKRQPSMCGALLGLVRKSDLSRKKCREAEQTVGKVKVTLKIQGKGVIVSSHNRGKDRSFEILWGDWLSLSQVEGDQVPEALQKHCRSLAPLVK